MTEKKSLSISARSFFLSMSIIIILMIAAYALTFVLPNGKYVRPTDAAFFCCSRSALVIVDETQEEHTTPRD